MKIVSETDINASVEKTAHLLMNPSNSAQWMRGLKRYEHIKGRSGQPGERFRLVGDMVFEGMVTSRTFPNKFTFTLESDTILIHATATLAALLRDKTHYTLKQDFTFKNSANDSFKPQTKQAIKAQQSKDVRYFKEFVEKHTRRSPAKQANPA